MQSYKDPQSSPGGRGAAPPITMTMSLNGPPGYHMQPSPMHGYLPHQPGALDGGPVVAGGGVLGDVTAGGASIAGAEVTRTQREQYVTQQHQQPQQGSRSKQSVGGSPGSGAAMPGASGAGTSSSGGGGGGGAGMQYRARPDQMQLTAQHQHMLQHQQRQHGMSSTHLRSTAMGMHSPQQQHQHHIHHQQHHPSQLHGSQQSAQMSYMSEKDSRGASGVFKTPPALGYSASAVGSPAVGQTMTNGIPGMHPQQYSGFHMMKDTPMRGESSGMVDSMKQRMGAGTSGSVSAMSPRGQAGPGGIAGFRQSGSTNSSESSRHHAQQAGLHSPQQQQQQHVMMHPQTQQSQQSQQHLAQHSLHHHQQQQPSHLQSVPHAGPQASHYPGHTPQKAALSSGSHVTPHSLPQNPMALPLSHRAVAPSHGQVPPAPIYAPAPPTIHPPSHPGLSPVTQDPHTHQLHHHHPQGHPTQPPMQPSSHLRSGSSPPPPGADLYLRASPASAPALTSRHQGLETGMNVHADGSMQLLSVRSQPSVGSIRTGEPRVQTQSAGSSSTRSASTSGPLMGVSGGAGLVPTHTMSKGSIQMGTPAVKPVVINTDVRVNSEVTRGCKVSPGGNGPLDLSKIRPEPTRPGDCPLDLSVKPRKRPLEEGGQVDDDKELASLALIKKPRSGPTPPKSSYELSGLHYSSNMPVVNTQPPGLTSQTVKPSTVPVKGDHPGNPSIPVMTYPTSQGFKAHMATPSMSGYLSGPALQSSVAGAPPKVPHSYTYPDRGNTHSRSNSSSSRGSTPLSRPHSIEMTFEGKGEDLSSLMPKIVKGITASPPTMISSLHSQLERVQQLKPEVMPGHGHSIPMKHQHPHQLPSQQMMPRDVVPSYAMNGCEKPRTVVSDTHMQKSVSVQQQQQQQQQQSMQLQRHQQACCPPKTAQSLTMGTPKASPQSTSQATSEPHSLEFPASQHVGQPHLYSQQKYHHQMQKQQQLQQHQLVMHRHQSQQQQQRIQMMHEHQQKQQQHYQHVPWQQSQKQQAREAKYGQQHQQQLQQGIVGSPYMYDMAVREHDIHKVKQHFHGPLPDGAGNDALPWRQPEVPSSSIVQGAGLAAAESPVIMRPCSDKQHHQQHSSTDKSIVASASTAGPSPSLRPVKFEESPRSENCRSGYYARKPSLEISAQEGEKQRSTPSSDLHSAHQSSLLRVQEKDTKNLKGSAGAAGDAVATAVSGDSCKQVENVASSGRIVTGGGTREQGVEDTRAPSPVSQEHGSLVDDALSGERTTPPTPKKAADSFQRPHPINVGSGSNVGGSTSISSKKPFDSTSQAEVVSKEAAAIKSESCTTVSPAPSEDFTTPLSISIPHSPAQEVDSKQGVSAIPPPPKMLPRKRMILNAYNKDETMRKFIGVPAPKGDLGPPGSTVSKTDHPRPRHISSSPPPSSPKMPILSPQEKGNEADVTSAQNDDPPTLDPLTPVRNRPTKSTSSTSKGSSNSGSGSGGGMSLAAGGGSAGMVVAPGGPGGAQVSSPIAITMEVSVVNTNSKLPITSTAATNPNPELEIGADKSESVVVRRCSLTAGDPGERLADPSSQQAGGQVPVSFSRPDVIRRPSLDRPWGHPQKIIPVANVAPFMHNKSAAELSGKEYTDPPQSSRGLEPSPHELAQPKSEDRKVLDERKREGVQPEDDETKSLPTSALQAKDLSSSEKRKQTQRSKTVKKTSKLIKKLTSIGKCKPKPGDVVDDLGVPPLSLKYKVLKSSQMFDVHDLDSIPGAERKDKTLKKKLAKQKHALKTALQAGGEKTKPGGLDEENEEREDDEEAAQASGATPEKSKKDLAQSREERANRRAMLRREEERRSGRKQQKPGKRTARRRLSSTNQKARELKRSAIARRPRRETTKRKSGQYNRNAAYEEEVKRDESRKAIRRARRHASNLARERLQQQQHHNDATDAGDNSQDETQSLPRDDEPWDIASAFSSSRPSRKSKSARGVVGTSCPDGGAAIARASGKQLGAGLESSDVDEEYYHDADDESKDVSDDDDDAADADFADGNSQSSRGKSRSLASRKKRRGKSRLRRKHAESCFDDNFESGREDTLLYGEDTVELSGSQCALPVPPEVKRIAVNKNSGETLLHRAARLGNEEVTLYCLRSGEYNVNARDNAGYTALHESCVKGSVRVARHLILHGADVNCCSLDGIRPLHDAVENDHVQVVRLLLSHGADPLIATYGGKTPHKIARSASMFDLIKGYLGDLNGYGSEDERPWQMPGSYGLHAATGDPDNGFDIFADVPSDGDDVDIDNLFDDGITASIATYLLPAEDTNSNPQPVVLQDDLLRQLRIPFKQFSSMSCCMRAQVHVNRPHILRMLEHSALRRGSLQHHALLESDKLTFLPVAVLSKVEAALEQLTRRPSPKTPAMSTSGSFGLLPELQSDNDILLIRHLGEMSLRHRDDGGADSAVDDEDTKDGCRHGGALKKFVTSGKITNGGHDGKPEGWVLSQCEKSAVMWVKKEKNPLHGCCAQPPSRACTPVPSAPAQRPLPEEVSQSASASGIQDQDPDGAVDKTYLLQAYGGPHVPSADDKRPSSRCQSEKHSPFRAVSDTSSTARTQSEAMTSYSYQYSESSLPPSSAAAPVKPSSVLLKAAHFQPTVVKKEFSEVEILSSVSSVSGVGSHTPSLMPSSRATTKSGGAVTPKGVGSGIGKATEGSGSVTRSSAPSSAAHTWGNSRGSGRRSTSAGGGLVSSGNSVVIKSSSQGPSAGHVTSGDKGQSSCAPPAPLPASSMESSEMLSRTASAGHESCSPANGSREPRTLPWLSPGGRILASCSSSRSGREPSQEHKKSPAFTSGSSVASSRESSGATHSSFPASLTSAPGREAGRDARGGKSPSMIPTTFSSAFTQFVNKDLPVIYGDYPRSESRTVQRSSGVHVVPKGSSQEHLTSSIKRSAASCPSSLSSTAGLSTASSSHTSGRMFSKELKSQPRPSQRPASGKKQEALSSSSSSSLSLSTSSQSFTSGKLTPKELTRSPHSAGSAPSLVSLGLSRNGSSSILESTPTKCLPSSVPSHGLLSASSVIKDSGNREAYQTLSLGESQVLPGVQELSGGRKVDTKAKNPQLDFVQMFSDESSSNSFTTVVDNLDYDSSHSPVGTAGVTVTSGIGSEVNAAEPKMSSTGTTSLGASAKSFGFGVFGRSTAGKDTNDNEIHLFTRTKP